ncbi:MAG: hypothetical protein HC893_14765 [Chloroflexaceae bacterium]|nr:hypothetical protein [Chloroflexaceae bacterium]
MSDAGEPSGTAGRPMLAILRGSGLGDVTVVVTRYFGGTLLGTGGLVHAYSDTTKAVLAILPRTEHIEHRTLLIAIPYNAYTPARQLLAAHHANHQRRNLRHRCHPHRQPPRHRSSRLHCPPRHPHQRPGRSPRQYPDPQTNRQGQCETVPA